MNLGEPLGPAAVAAIWVAVGVVGTRVLVRLGARVLRARGVVTKDPLGRIRRPLSCTAPLLLLWISRPNPGLSKEVFSYAYHAVGVLLMLGIAVTLTRALWTCEHLVVDHFEHIQQKTTRSRRLKTQLRGFRNLLSFVVWLLCLSLALMTFEGAREIGATLLASAGVAGIVVGFAAQRSLATLIAGISMTITQPLRVDDAVHIEGQFGWIEEITLTYVVVRTWDQRHLILPITYFNERPFQNWSRDSPDILTTVFMDVSPKANIQALREAFELYAKESEHFDGKVCKLHVWDIQGTHVQLRLLLSARDGIEAVALRCELRERLLLFLQDKHPDWLATMRVEVPRNTSSDLEDP